MTSIGGNSGNPNANAQPTDLLKKLLNTIEQIRDIDCYGNNSIIKQKILSFVV